MLANDLNDLLIRTFNITPDNSRKLIQRKAESKLIGSTKPLTFGYGQFYYYDPQFKPSREEIKELLKERRPPVYRLLQLLDITGGAISFYEGLKITSSPDESANSKVSFLKDIIIDLGKLRFVVERSDEFGINYILNRCEDEEDYKLKMLRHRENIQLDTVFNADLMGWLLDANIIATYGNFRSASNPGFGVEHNNLFWDAFAYSKISGVNLRTASESNSIQKQTLVVLDIVIYRDYSLNDLNGFIARIQINNNSVKGEKRRSIPVIIYNKSDDHTINVAKKLGFLIFSLAKIYGSNINRLLVDIKATQTSINTSLADGVEAALKKIDVSGQKAKLKNLRGILFEALMRPILESIYPNSQIFPSKLLKHPDKEMTREFDYIIVSSNPKELILVELKGYAGNSYIRLGDSKTKGTLRYFFRGSIPLAKDYYKDDMILESHLIKAIFITTGEYHSECNDFIEASLKSSQIPSRMDSSICNGVALMKLLKENNFDHELNIVNQYYIKVDEEE